MEKIREWWASVVEFVIYWLSRGWERLWYGITEGWDVRYFIFGMGFILIVGLIYVWRRNA